MPYWLIFSLCIVQYFGKLYAALHLVGIFSFHQDNYSTVYVLTGVCYVQITEQTPFLSPLVYSMILT